MRKTLRRITAAAIAVMSLFGNALTASALLNYSDLPYYCWNDTPNLYEDGIVCVSSEKDPLIGYVVQKPITSGVFFRTDMENVTAEALGLPEGTEIEHPDSYDFFNLKSSYLYSDESFYQISDWGVDAEIIDALVANEEIETVVTETFNYFSATTTLAICIVSENATEITPDDFEGMMVEKVVHMADNEFVKDPNICYVHLSAEAFDNGVDYNVLYDYILNDFDIEYTSAECGSYQIDSEDIYWELEIVPHRCVYTTLKGEFTAASEDANGDYAITLDDAVTVLQSYADNAVASEPVYNESHDANADGTVDLDDAVAVLSRYAADAVGL